MIKKTTQTGFTLIEVLLVISIIGVIFSIIMANLQDARYNARDASIKQQVRTTATLFEFQRNENNGIYENYLLGVVGNDGVSDNCSDKNFQGSYATKLQELCEGIVREAEYTDGIVLAYRVNNPYRTGGHFSIMTQLNNGNWYCVGSNGGTYEGPFLTTASGCPDNP